MAKLKHDKYYTDDLLAKELIEKTFKIIGENNITRIIEPSAGAGSFLKHLNKYNKEILAYDILPECKKVIKEDYLKTDIEYVKGSLTIGNPPFGSSNNLSRRFYQHSIKHSDFIAFIQPISQLNNTQSLYQFDLIHSEDLGKMDYSGRKVHCCYNIYKRPINGLNARVKYNIKGMDYFIYEPKSKATTEAQHKRFNDTNWDIVMVKFGDAGKIIDTSDVSSYCRVKCFKFNLPNSKDVIKFIKEFDWKSYINSTAAGDIKKWHIVEKLWDEFPELKA